MGTSAGGEEQYHLKWNDYNSSLTKCFRDLRDNDEMLDVTLVSQGQTFKAHKLVLSACSPIFKSMLKKTSQSGGMQQPFLQPFIFLHNVRREDIEAILDFMYNGEVSVSQDDLRSFLGVAEELRVRGLTQMDVDSKTEEPREDSKKKRKLSNNEDNEVIDPKRYLSASTAEEEEPVIQEPEFGGHSSPYQAFPSPSSQPRASNSMESPGLDPTGQVSYHRLGGRDVDDPLSNVVVTHSDRGWHCPDCIHIATTKGNLKSHILSGRHKVGEKNFKCRFCDRSYSTRQSLQVHISTNHRRERDLEVKPTVSGHHHSNSQDFFSSAKYEDQTDQKIFADYHHEYYDSSQSPS